MVTDGRTHKVIIEQTQGSCNKAKQTVKISRWQVSKLAVLLKSNFMIELSYCFRFFNIDWQLDKYLKAFIHVAKWFLYYYFFASNVVGTC